MYLPGYNTRPMRQFVRPSLCFQFGVLVYFFRSIQNELGTTLSMPKVDRSRGRSENFLYYKYPLFGGGLHDLSQTTSIGFAALALLWHVMAPNSPDPTHTHTHTHFLPTKRNGIGCALPRIPPVLQIYTPLVVNLRELS